MSDQDKQFALVMRQSLLQLAQREADPDSRRALLRMVSAIERRYQIPKLRIVKSKQDTA